MLYVDKTHRLLELVTTGRRYFIEAAQVREVINSINAVGNVHGLCDFARFYDWEISPETTGSRTLLQIIFNLYKTHGQVIILIDEYDKPILDNLTDLKKANEMREVLRSFYLTLKSCDKYLRFVILTGISKFSKVGVFSALNNLEDISMDERYGDIVGYTQSELENYFNEWLTEVHC